MDKDRLVIELIFVLIAVILVFVGIYFTYF
jgi:hypothetical protein|nr:MAG TPA: protein of unknown function (DUF5412) [Caudoviricetes sp.]